MAELGLLERAKRRHLQESYADLRPDERQAKLRCLLLGATADAGLPSSGPQATRAAAAAAAASIAAVSNSPGGKGGVAAGSRRGALPALLHSQARSPGPGPSRDPGANRHPRHPDAGPPARAPPPGPMEGGFLQEVDPIQRLSRLQARLGRGAGAAGGGATGAAVGSPGVAAASAAGGLRGAGAGAGADAATPCPAVRYDIPDKYDELLADADVPSDVELALISLKSDLRSHPACAELPPLVLRSQLSDMLADRSTVERQLDEQQRANRVRVFKLPTGADEFGVLTTSDYRAIVREAADAAAAAATATSADRLQKSRRAQSAPGALGVAAVPADAVGSPSCGAPQSWGAYGSTVPEVVGGGGSGVCSARTSHWHRAAEAFLRGVIDRFTEFQLSHTHLVHLLSTIPIAAQPRQPTAQPASALRRRAPQPTEQQRAEPVGPSVEAVDEQLSLLLHLGCLARHTEGDADAYVLAVPGAGKWVKAVLGGRKELTTWLAKRQRREAPEEQVCKLKLRSSCLPPAYHVRDLVGRGAAARLASTTGPMIRLTGIKR